MSSSINYAALDAEDNEAAAEQRYEEAVAPPTRKRPSRHALTEDERLAKALAQVETLQQKVLAKREERRSRLVEDLYRKYDVVEGQGDLGEAKRISELRKRLGL